MNMKLIAEKLRKEYGCPVKIENNEIMVDMSTFGDWDVLEIDQVLNNLAKEDLVEIYNDSEENDSEEEFEKLNLLFEKEFEKRGIDFEQWVCLERHI